jgi:nucleoside-diphosphate-sugar epimerase
MADVEGQFWSGRRVFVTGASGFLGYHLIRRLHTEGADLFALTRAGSLNLRLKNLESCATFLEGDVRDAASLKRALEAAKPDVVYHMAAAGASGPSDPETMLATNVNGTFNISTACVPLNLSRFVYLGSCGEYGDGHNLTEDQVLRPSNIYSASKASGHAIVQSVGLSNGLSVVTARPFATYGPWAQTSRLVPHAIACALQGKDIELRASWQQRDYIFVDDVIEGLLLCGSRPRLAGLTFNLCSGAGMSASDIVSRLLELMGQPVRMLPGAIPMHKGEMSHQSGSYEHASAVLGWSPRSDLDAGLSATIDWYRENMHLLSELA